MNLINALNVNVDKTHISQLLIIYLQWEMTPEFNYQVIIIVY